MARKSAAAAGESFRVARVMARRADGRYKIRWRGYSAKHDTWEPLANVASTGHVDRFERRERRRGLGGGADAPGLAVLEYQDGEREAVDPRAEKFRRDGGEDYEDLARLVNDGADIEILWPHAKTFFSCQVVSFTPPLPPEEPRGKGANVRPERQKLVRRGSKKASASAVASRPAAKAKTKRTASNTSRPRRGSAAGSTDKGDKQSNSSTAAVSSQTRSPLKKSAGKTVSRKHVKEEPDEVLAIARKPAVPRRQRAATSAVANRTSSNKAVAQTADPREDERRSDREQLSGRRLNATPGGKRRRSSESAELRPKFAARSRGVAISTPAATHNNNSNSKNNETLNAISSNLGPFPAAKAAASSTEKEGKIRDGKQPGDNEKGEPSPKDHEQKFADEKEHQVDQQGGSSMSSGTGQSVDGHSEKCSDGIDSEISSLEDSDHDHAESSEDSVTGSSDDNAGAGDDLPSLTAISQSILAAASGSLPPPGGSADAPACAGPGRAEPRGDQEHGDGARGPLTKAPEEAAAVRQGSSLAVSVPNEGTMPALKEGRTKEESSEEGSSGDADTTEKMFPAVRSDVHNSDGRSSRLPEPDIAGGTEMSASRAFRSHSFDTGPVAPRLHDGMPSSEQCTNFAVPSANARSSVNADAQTTASTEPSKEESTSGTVPSFPGEPCSPTSHINREHAALEDWIGEYNSTRAKKEEEEKGAESDARENIGGRSTVESEQIQQRLMMLQEQHRYQQHQKQGLPSGLSPVQAATTAARWPQQSATMAAAGGGAASTGLVASATPTPGFFAPSQRTAAPAQWGSASIHAAATPQQQHQLAMAAMGMMPAPSNIIPQRQQLARAVAGGIPASHGIVPPGFAQTQPNSIPYRCGVSPYPSGLASYAPVASPMYRMQQPLFELQQQLLLRQQRAQLEQQLLGEATALNRTAAFGVNDAISGALEADGAITLSKDSALGAQQQELTTIADSSAQKPHDAQTNEVINESAAIMSHRQQMQQQLDETLRTRGNNMYLPR